MGKKYNIVVKISFRFDHEFLSKLNHLILQRYNDLNVEDEENVSNDQVHCEEVCDNAHENLESKQINEKSGTKVSSSSSLFCFRLFSASRKFNI